MAMKIQILTDNDKPICAYDGHSWNGNINPIVMSEAVELLVIGLSRYREMKIIQRMSKPINSEPELVKD